MSSNKKVEEMSKEAVKIWMAAFNRMLRADIETITSMGLTGVMIVANSRTFEIIERFAEENDPRTYDIFLGLPKAINEQVKGPHLAWCPSGIADVQGAFKHEFAAIEESIRKYE